jgi:hypothetical protein
MTGLLDLLVAHPFHPIDDLAVARLLDVDMCLLLLSVWRHANASRPAETR